MSPMRDGQTNEQTREDRATHPMEAGWLSFAICVAFFQRQPLTRGQTSCIKKKKKLYKRQKRNSLGKK